MPDAEHETLKQFVQLVDLRSIQCVECRARNYVAIGNDEDLLPFESQPKFQLKVHTPDADEPPTSFHIQVHVVVNSPQGEAEVAYLASYDHKAKANPPIELLTEFTNNVALMALLPYLRATLADITTRVFGRPLLMPMFQRGQLTFKVPERQEE